MRILIAGQGKSGTTALFFTIRNSLGPAVCLFEPKSYDAEDATIGLPVIAKVLLFIDVDYESFERFDKKILIVRDPRDRLISSLLYAVRHSRFCLDNKKLAAFIEILEKKEKEPRAVPTLDVIKLFNVLNAGAIDSSTNLYATIRQPFLDRLLDIQDFAMRWHDSHGDYHLIKYEDFVDSRFDVLEKYLGFTLHCNTTVDKAYSRVERSKSYGSWKNWFLEEDVEYFKPLLWAYMQRYSYGDDWEINPKPYISSEQASNYVRRLAQETKRSQVNRKYQYTKPRMFKKLASYACWKLKQVLG